jgi:hypothetical protein
MMQQDASRMIKQLNNEALQTATGGCTGCGHIASAALRKSDKAISKALKIHAETRSAEAASPHSAKGIKLSGLAMRAANSMLMPPKPGCSHCKKFTGFAKELVSQL